MTRLLVAGVGPRPDPEQDKVFAPGLRLKTFLQVLIEAGHEIILAEASMADGASTPNKPEGVASFHSIELDPAKAAGEIQQIAEREKPDAVIALTEVMAYAAATANLTVPLYVDYNGHPMVERQMQAEVFGSNGGLLGQWQLVLPVLLRADRFATCSEAQRLALVGELGTVGRLNRETCGSDLVDVLRPPLPFDQPFEKGDSSFIRGKVVPEDSEIILYTGGYNTWLDEELLFLALERVLANRPNAQYVSTGGRIDGHVTQVFERFEQRVKRSEFSDRFHFVGWVNHREYEQCCLESDVGVMTDRWTLEGELGCRNRLYGWIWGGMRTVATGIAEIVVGELGPDGFIESIPPNNLNEFAKALESSLESGRYSEAESTERRERLEEKCSPNTYYQDLVEWAAHPTFAPDRPHGQSVDNGLAELQTTLMRMMKLQDTGQSMLDDASEVADRLLGSRAIRAYLALHPETEKLLKNLRDIFKGS